MAKSITWTGALVCLAILAGPFVFVTTQAGKADPADLYVIFDLGRDLSEPHGVGKAGAEVIGPVRGLLARMIQAPPEAHKQLLHQGFIVLPASGLAALCGFEVPSGTPQERTG